MKYKLILSLFTLPMLGLVFFRVPFVRQEEADQKLFWFESGMVAMTAAGVIAWFLMKTTKHNHQE